MDDDAEIHAIDGGVAIGNVDFAVEVFGGDGGVGFLDGFKGALEPADYLGFRGDALFHFLLELGGYFGSGDAEEIEIGEGDVHVDFARGAHGGRGTPRESVLRGGLGQVEELVRDVLPFTVLALPDSFGDRLRKEWSGG